MSGLLYDFDNQCKFSFGINATHCRNKKSECSELWCKLNEQDSCVTRSEKAAEGTLCGHDLNHVTSSSSECLFLIIKFNN